MRVGWSGLRKMHEAYKRLPHRSENICKIDTGHGECAGVPTCCWVDWERNIEVAQVREGTLGASQVRSRQRGYMWVGACVSFLPFSF